MKKLLLILAMISIAFGCMACDDYDDITYYNAIGEGYVFMYDDKNRDRFLFPAQGAEITVTTTLENKGSFFPYPKETFITDVTGKYQVRFTKRTYRSNATKYFFDVSCSLCVVPPNYDMSIYGTSPGMEKLTRNVDDIKNAKNIIEIDTIKIYVSNK
jgi:hypothetical protein